MRRQKCSQDLQPQSCLSFQFISSSAENFSAALPLTIEKEVFLCNLPVFSAAINFPPTIILHGGAGLRLPKYHHSNAGSLCFRLQWEWLSTTLKIYRFQSLLFLLLLSILNQHVTWNYLISAPVTTFQFCCLSLWRSSMSLPWCKNLPLLFSCWWHSARLFFKSLHNLLVRC